jgi:hypothetical protein
VREAALADQVDDQLQLVQALVVRDLGLVAGLDERLEAGRISSVTPPQSTACSPKRSLSVSSRRSSRSRPRAARRSAAVGERELERLAARVLRDRDERRRAEPSVKRRRTTVPGPFGATMITSWPAGG